jgi:hypothetical protein
MFELIFTESKTGTVVYAVSNVRLIRHITLREIGFVDTKGRIRAVSFLQNENLEVNRIPPRMTSERQQEIDAATSENPVEDSPADKAIKLKDKGMSNAAIAKDLGIDESVVRRILRVN